MRGIWGIRMLMKSIRVGVGDRAKIEDLDGKC